MADSTGPADKAGEAPSRLKTVRSQNFIPSRQQDGPPSAAQSFKTAGVSDNEEDDEAPLPLPHSHTPGHLASKNSADRRSRPSEVVIRQRSQSTSHVPSAAAPKPLPGSSSARVAPRVEEVDESTTRTPPQRPATAAAGTRSAVLASTDAPRTTPRLTRPPRGPHVPFPPLHDPKDAPDVEPAPPSGMYWSKAVTCGSPHPNLRAHTATLIGSNVYIFGGWDLRTCFNVYVLDADALYWSVPYMVGDFPVPLRAMTCTAVGKKLVIFGGGDGPTYCNGVYVLDTVNFRWKKPCIVGDKLPCPRRAHTACLYRNGIYVFGGGDGEKALNDIWRLDVSDTTKMAWKLILSPERSPADGRESYPKTRGYHTGNMSGGKLIIYGGSDGTECFDDVWIYNVETHVWKAVVIPVTFRRLSHMATLVGSYLFVVGGHDGDEYCNDLILLNLVTMTWDKRKVYGKAPSGRGYHGAVLHDSRLLMIGGFDGNQVFGDVMILELAMNAYYAQISQFTIDV